MTPIWKLDIQISPLEVSCFKFKLEDKGMVFAGFLQFYTKIIPI